MKLLKLQRLFHGVCSHKEGILVIPFAGGEKWGLMGRRNISTEKVEDILSALMRILAAIYILDKCRTHNAVYKIQ